MSSPQNLGPQQARLRGWVGTIAGLATIGLGVWMLVTGKEPVWFALLVVPAFVAALGSVQAQAKT